MPLCWTCSFAAEPLAAACILITIQGRAQAHAWYYPMIATAHDMIWPLTWLSGGATGGGPTDGASSSLLTTTAAAGVEDIWRPVASGETTTEPGLVRCACLGAASACNCQSFC